MLENHRIREKELEDARDADWEMRQPECECCGEHIYDDSYFEINGRIICEECFKENCKMFIPDDLVLICDCCGKDNKDEDIDFYDINGERLCEDCVESYRVINERY